TANRRDDDMVFLHEVVEGASSESYGIEVAKMAGVPRGVVDRAREVIEERADAEMVESDEDDIADNEEYAEIDVTELKEEVGNGGSDIEHVDSADHATHISPDIIDDIRDADVANMTPLEALNKLNSLKNKLDDTDT
ncbi:MAG: DNA mismatch repair protein MutS, partial [Halobacteria archaeon]|nr:DNA mismatch repair protein MutS [Halobacteria archaeon]